MVDLATARPALHSSEQGCPIDACPITAPAEQSNEQSNSIGGGMSGQLRIAGRRIGLTTREGNLHREQRGCLWDPCSS